MDLHPNLLKVCYVQLLNLRFHLHKILNYKQFGNHSGDLRPLPDHLQNVNIQYQPLLHHFQIGRASCRERVYTSVDDGTSLNMTGKNMADSMSMSSTIKDRLKLVVNN